MRFTTPSQDDWVFFVRCRENRKCYTRYLGVSSTATEEAAVKLVRATVRPRSLVKAGTAPRILDMHWCRMHEIGARRALSAPPMIANQVRWAQHGRTCKSR